jgi:thiosulfate/3-mercaptopyruvate sulfurtransferase
MPLISSKGYLLRELLDPRAGSRRCQMANEPAGSCHNSSGVLAPGPNLAIFLHMNPKFLGYAQPEALVDGDWLQQNLSVPGVRIVESNEDVLLYDTGHIPGAVHIDWRGDLQDNTVRDYVAPEGFAEVCNKNGITPDTTVIFYGDKSNWWSCYALWAFRLFGHSKVKILDGGRDKWKADNRPLTREKPGYPRASYPVPPRRFDKKIRAFFDQTLAHAHARKPLIDVRSPREYTGELTHMPEYPQEGVLRGGHVPGARNVPWKIAANEDATFKPADELAKIYTQGLGLKPGDDIIAYCRIGERSSHTWFVLTYLLGYSNIRNYDGSWTEWGNRVRSPIAKGEQPG